MPYVELPMKPSVLKDDTVLAAQGYFADADKMRFVRGKAQVIGGWEKASETQFDGKCRGLHGWSGSSGIFYCAVGTNTHLYVYSDAEIYDVTPIVALGTLTNPFTTTDTETEVNVEHVNHGRSAGDGVFYANATPVGGLTLNGAFTVTQVVDADNYTITADSAATSTATGGGTVDYDYYLSIGLEDGTGPAGYGTGAWGVGEYGDSTFNAFYPRTWSLSNWVQNLVANPRGGGLYEWAPNFADIELVTNGDFSAGATGWTEGTGWTISAGAALATSGVGSLLTTQIAVLPNSYVMLEFDITRSTGTLDVSIDSVDKITGLDATQRVRRVVYTSAGGTLDLSFDKDATFSGSVDNVSASQMTRAYAIPNAPAIADSMIVTPELIMMVFGTIDADTGIYNPMQVRNSDTGDGDLSANQIWTPAPDNLAYRFTLAKGSRLVGAKLGNGEIPIWSDTSLFRCRYTGDTNQPYVFQLISEGCGLIGANAAAVLSGIAYWVTPAKDFMVYDGGSPREMYCPMDQDFSDNLAPVQQDKIFAWSFTGFGEVWWLYPDSRDDLGLECSRYLMVKVATPESPEASWAPGTFDRTAFIETTQAGFPMATSSDGYLYFQEKGKSADGSAIQWLLETAAMDVKLNGDGGELYQINFFIPDQADLIGGYDYTMIAYELPNSTPQEFGPYPVSSGITRLDFDPPIARQAAHRFEGNSAPAFCRFGAPRLDISKTGMIY